MSEENPGMRKASHVGLWVCMVVVGGWLVWSATHSKTMNKKETFATGSSQTNNYKITRNYGLAFVDLALFPFTIHGCTKPDKIEGEQAQAINEVADEKQLVNAVVKGE